MDKLEPDIFYHIYNHAIGHENLFRDERDYLFFIRKMKEFLSPVVDFYAYTLMPNHFHFVVKIKEEKEILSLTLKGSKTLSESSSSPSQIEISNFISRRFSHLFNSYAQAYNKSYNRKGSLFQRPFQRKRVVDEKYLVRLIHYVYYNPVNHGFVDKVNEWRYSSYNAIIFDKPTLIIRKDVIMYFDNIENLKFCHQIEPVLSGLG